MDWKDLELLAHRIYSELEPSADVRHDDHIMGRNSGIERQVDVSIRTNVAGHEVLVVVDAKDRSRRPTVQDIDGFASFVDDVGAQKGILLCSKGFGKNALGYARRKGLDLCQAHDATSRKWALDVKLPFVWVNLTPKVSFELGVTLLGEDSFPKDPSEWAVVTTENRRLLLTQTFERTWNDGTVPRTSGAVHTIVPTEKDLRFAVIDASGAVAMRPVDRVLIKYEVERSAYLGSLTPDECRGIQHADGRFVASYIRMSNLPLERDPSWPAVDESALPVALGTTVLTSEGWELLEGSATVGDVFLTFLGHGGVVETDASGA